MRHHGAYHPIPDVEARGLDVSFAQLGPGYGHPTVASERALRTHLAAWPRGTNAAEAFLDDDGVRVGQPIRLHVVVTNAFLRSLARLDLVPSVVGALEPGPEPAVEPAANPRAPQ